MDASARVTMKDAAKCDMRCEWQNSANQKNAERILHFQDIPGSTSASGRIYFMHASEGFMLLRSYGLGGKRCCVSAGPDYNSPVDA